MSDTTTETTETVEPQDTTTEPQEPQESEKGNKAGRDAARYRTQLREAEAELETLRGRVTTEAHAAVDAAAAAVIRGEPNPGSKYAPPQRLRDPSDLARYTDGGRGAFLGEDGKVDADKVTAALTALQAERPYLFQHGGGGNHVRSEGRVPADPARGPGFAEAFAPQA